MPPGKLDAGFLGYDDADIVVRRRGKLRYRPTPRGCRSTPCPPVKASFVPGFCMTIEEGGGALPLIITSPKPWRYQRPLCAMSGHPPRPADRGSLAGVVKKSAIDLPFFRRVF